MIPHPLLILALTAQPADEARAPAFDGSQNLVCAITEMQQCSPGEGCEAITPADANVPQFLRFDFKKKQISGRRPDGTLVNTPIAASSRLEDAIAMQGVEGLYGWSVSLGIKGEIGITISGASHATVAFGACSGD
jgi:hypothetical protein